MPKRQTESKNWVRKALTTEEVDELLNACETTRDRVVITVLAYQGLRANELLRLKPEHYNRKHNTLFIPAKEIDEGRDYVKSDDREIPIMSHHVNTALDEWFRSCNGFNFSYITLYRIIKTVAARTNIKKTITLHVLRHTAATWLAYKDFSAASIAEFLGHCDIGTAAKFYIHPTGGMMRKEVGVRGDFDD